MSSISNKVDVTITGWEAHLNQPLLTRYLILEMNLKGRGNIVFNLLANREPINFSVSTFEVDGVVERLTELGAIFEIKGN